MYNYELGLSAVLVFRGQLAATVVGVPCPNIHISSPPVSKPRQQFTPLYLRAVVDNDQSEKDKAQAQLELGPTT